MRERRKEIARRFLDEDQHRIEERFLASQLPRYGLPPSFQGLRMAGVYRTVASGRSARDVDTVTVQLELIHGDPLETPLRSLIVATSRNPQPPQQPTPLRHLLWERVVAEHAAIQSRRRLFGPSVPKRETVGGSERLLAVPIDQVPQDFTVIEEGVVQAAELNLRDHRITLRAHRWPIEDVELVTITELVPYLEGRRRFMMQRRADLGVNY